jgi:YYY domain-containing protein
MRPWAQVLLWYLFLTALGVCVLPYSRMIFRRTPGAALVLARGLALVLVPYGCWLLGNVAGWPFTRAGVAALVAVLACGWFLPPLRRWQRPWAEIRSDWPMVWRSEVAFVVALAAGAWVKMRLNRIAGEGEKFMDLSLFAHLTRLLSFPPADPWMAGEGFTINYYYGGHLVFATLAKLSALPLGVVYNLSIASLFAFTVLHAFFLGRALCGGSMAGILAAFLVGVAGNLDPAWQAWQRGALLPIRLVPSTRVVVDGDTAISEYPLFSFYWSDLHGHLNALPFGLLFLALLWEIVSRSGAGARGAAFRVGSVAFGIGFLGFVNGMDGPGYAVVAGAMLLLAALARLAALPMGRRWARALAGAAAELFAAGVLAAVLFAPYVLAYQSPLRPGFPLAWTMWRTDLGELARFWGVQLAALVPFAALSATRALGARRRVAGAILGVALAVSIVGWMQGAGPTTVALLLLLAPILAAVATQDVDLAGRFVMVLGALALLALIGCELIYIRDYYDWAIQRRMTIFKVFFLAWIWLGIVAPYALQRLARSRMPLLLRSAAAAPFAILAVCSLAAPYEVVREARGPFAGPLGLDGQAYLALAHPAEHRAFAWLQREVTGTPAIVEAHGDPYGYYFRVSANTGLPTILGSVEHERTVYGRSALEADMRRRIDDIREIYETQDADVARALLERYGVEYVFVGVLERNKYRVGLDKFERGPFEKVYEDDVSIYRLRRPRA